MGSENWQHLSLSSPPFEIIDGDRGVNYPHGDDFSERGDCLFLNAKNVTIDGLRFENCQFITYEKDRALSKGKTKRGDIILTTRGTIGNVAYYSKNVPFDNIRINSGMVILRCDQKTADSLFIYWLFRSPLVQKQIKSFTTGSAQPQLPINIIKSIGFLIPYIAEQHSIAATLSCLDDKIELNNRIIANLEAQAQAIFEEWMISENDFISGCLSDIAEINPSRKLMKGQPATYIGMADLSTSFSYPNRWTLNVPYNGGMRFQNGDTLIARITPCLENGKTAFISCLNEDEIGFGSTEYIVLAPKAGYCQELLYFLARNKDFRNYAIQNMNGSSGRQRVSGETIAAYEMVLPSKDLSRHFEAVAKPIMAIINRYSKQNVVLANLRDTLLPKLMSGEIEL